MIRVNDRVLVKVTAYNAEIAGRLGIAQKFVEEEIASSLESSGKTIYRKFIVEFLNGETASVHESQLMNIQDICSELNKAEKEAILWRTVFNALRD